MRRPLGTTASVALVASLVVSGILAAAASAVASPTVAEDDAAPILEDTALAHADGDAVGGEKLPAATPETAAEPARGVSEPAPKAVSNEIRPGTAQIVPIRFEDVSEILVVSHGAPQIRIQTIDPLDNVLFSTQGGPTTHHRVHDEGRILPSGVWRVELHNDGDQPARVAYEIASRRADVALTPQGFPPDHGLAVGTRALVNGEPLPADAVATAMVTAPDGSFRTALMYRSPDGRDWRADFPGASPGVYVARTMFDVSGRRSSTAFTVVAGVPETTPPSLELLTVPAASNARGWFARDVQVTIRASDAGSGVAQVERRVDGGEPQTTGESVVVIDLAHGEHTIEYRAVDRLGNATGCARARSGSTRSPRRSTCSCRSTAASTSGAVLTRCGTRARTTCPACTSAPRPHRTEARSTRPTRASTSCA
ncbi:OmpL47-type beta-barrel domain-containing protein [Microbacterium album]|uniref:OmpL47-type beta-barrel domain-containing protein n=1 Tax=Microbacterium album TaxID=2053191 RepID=UPI0016684B28|nr:hypothetical protein [Microbacterium album]